MKKIGLFEGYGIELEYIIVRTDTLDVLPLADEVLRAAAGRYTTDYDNGVMGWSNELVSHLIEVKNVVPLPSLKGLARSFHKETEKIHEILRPLNGRLMPSGMHPWMNPRRETRLWNHRYRHIYETYDGIFNCRRHGWANVQSMHLNISFSNDGEFGRLHAAVRLLLPLIPALAASSPIAEGRVTGRLDTRLSYYSANQRRVPSITGRIIPEPVYTKSAYRSSILQKMFRDIARHDPGGILQNEWLNSRGTVPRFERSAMEIRVIDTQECPAADIAVAEAIAGVLKLLASGRWSSSEDQKSWKTAPLASILRKTGISGEKTVLDHARYLALFGFPGKRARASELWEHLVSEARSSGYISRESEAVLRVILRQGTLARRILGAAGKSPSRKRLMTVYETLCQCLASNELFA
ncbi:MAG: hypothetical protein JSU90_11960 [Nitrospiraceae bacterium]|nr:MAG: hypothetical protein JSU90_11960 [Nitrospiraceae bacterium]